MNSPLDNRVKNPEQLMQLAKYIDQVRYEDLSPKTVATTKNFIMDCIAVGVAGCSYDATDKALAAATNWGKGNVRVIGRKQVTLPSASAAFVNGMQIHCLEWDGLHEPSVVIALCAPMGALSAEIQRKPVSGKALIAAFVAAIEVAVFFGGSKEIAPRFFRPSIAGALAATAGVAKLRGLSVESTAQALALVYGQISGTMQAHWEGSMALPMQVGVSARSAISSVDMAEAGMTGPIDFISGQFGYFKLFETGVDIDKRFAALSDAPKILEVAHKPYPAGRATQAALTMWTGLLKDRSISAEDIKRITVDVPPLIELLVGRPAHAGMTPSYARLCLKFVLPLMIIEGRVDPRQFKESVFSRQDIVALGDRIIINNDGNPDKNALGPQQMLIELNDGTQISANCLHPLGSPANPLSQEACNEKVIECLHLASHPMDHTAFITLCQDLEQLDDSAKLLDLVC